MEVEEPACHFILVEVCDYPGKRRIDWCEYYEILRSLKRDVWFHGEAAKLVVAKCWFQESCPLPVKTDN